MKFTFGLFGAVVLFFVAAYVASKYPSVNLLGKVLP